MIKKQSSRIQHHRLTTSGVAFTVPTDDSDISSWRVTDLALGEVGINLADSTLFIRAAAGIIQLSSTGIWTISNVHQVVPFTTSGANIAIGTGNTNNAPGTAEKNVIAGNTHAFSGSDNLIGGLGHTVAGDDNLVCGLTNVVAGTGYSLVSGKANQSTGEGNTCSGENNTITASNASAEGISNLTTADYSHAAGNMAIVDHIGEHGIGGGGTTDYTGQIGSVQLGCVTTTNSSVEAVVMNKSATKFTVAADTVYKCRVYALGVALNNGSSNPGDCASFTGQCTIKNVAGTVSLVSTCSMTQNDADSSMSGTLVNVSASGNYLKIAPTGIASNNVAWQVRIDYEKISAKNPL